MHSIHKIEVLGFNVFSDQLDFIPIHDHTTKVINTISPNSYGICMKNAFLDHALRNTDYLVLDGVYFALASILLKGENIKRNQGPDVFYHFMNRLNSISGTAFFLGSSTATIDRIIANALERYPNVKVYGYSPPFSTKFTIDENQTMLDQINLKKPDILFVGMTCPKQEIWSVQHREKLQVGLIISIGNVFDWFAGTQKSIHPIWFKLRLAWFIRIILRPQIFRRNIKNQMRFFKDVLIYFLRIRPFPGKFDSLTNLN